MCLDEGPLRKRPQCMNYSCRACHQGLPTDGATLKRGSVSSNGCRNAGRLHDDLISWPLDRRMRSHQRPTPHFLKPWRGAYRARPSSVPWQRLCNASRALTAPPQSALVGAQESILGDQNWDRPEAPLLPSSSAGEP